MTEQPIIVAAAPGETGAQDIRIPGERAAAERRLRSEQGVAVLAATWRAVRPFAERLGVSPPDAFPMGDAS